MLSGIIMKIFKLYLLSLKKSFTIRGRASRLEVVAFHIIGLIPIVLCLIVIWPMIHSAVQQSKQLLTDVTGNVSFTLPAQSTKPETFQGITNILSKVPPLKCFNGN
jgi:hypothetical protein